MKILQLIQKQQLRGAEIFASQLSTHLSDTGNTAIMVNLFGGDASLPFNGSTTSLNGNQKARLHDIAAWRKLAQIIRDENPDVIQANAGDKFDPELHEAIQFDEEATGDNEVIAEELQPGYRLNGRPIRHAMVKVTRN